MRILIAEDDTLIASGIAAALRQSGHASEWVSNVQNARLTLSIESFSMLILDIGLPDATGLTILNWLRSRSEGEHGTSPNTPVLVLTARDAIEDRVNALDLGADDYLTKPFDIRELMARVRVLLRRGEGRSSPLIVVGALQINPATREVHFNGDVVALSQREFTLIHTLSHSPGKVHTREQLESSLYASGEEVESNAIEVFVYNLRRKLGDASVIRTIRGVGYCLAIPEYHELP